MMRRARLALAVCAGGALASGCMTAPSSGHRRHLTFRHAPPAAGAPPATEPLVPGQALQPGHPYRGDLPPLDRVQPTPPPAAPVPPVASAVPIPGGVAVTPGIQYLYGSGEASALSVQAWRGLVAFVARSLAQRPADGVVLAPGATLAAPAFVPCGDKPFAVVLDVDETVLLNLGAEYDATLHPGPFDQKRWSAYERTGAATVAPVPGAAKALGALRTMGVAVIFNTNRSAASAAGAEAAIDGAGLGPAKHGDTLFMMGDDATGGHKDGRRARIAARYCVVAMAGDQLGDFSDLFNAQLPPVPRRQATLAAPIARLWGAGWFVLPNPVYGPGMTGGIDDVFPADKRWTPAP